MAFAWYDPSNPDTWFCMDRIVIKDISLDMALMQSCSMIDTEAMQLMDDSPLEKDVLKQIDSVASKSGLAKLSKKAVTAYKAAASSAGIANRQQLIEVFADGLSDGMIRNISSYAEAEMKVRVMGQIINNIVQQRDHIAKQRASM